MTYRRLRGLRRACQLLFFTAFVALFALAVYPIRTPVPPDIFLRSDPLIALSTMVSLRRIVLPLLWFALPVAGASIVLGRVFCGWVCPMGTAIDIGERVAHLRGRRPSQAPPWRRLKFYVLVGLLGMMALPVAHRSARELGVSQSVGLSAIYVMDPIALITRTFALAGTPAAQWLARYSSDTVTGWTYADFADRHPLLLRALSPVQLGLSAVARPVYFRAGLLTFAVFVGIIALGRVARRFWCRNLCPLGALLGAMGKWSALRLAVSDRCTRCLRCVNECKMGAITENPKVYLGAECIQCHACAAVCPEGAISVTLGSRQVGRETEVRLDRRRLLGSLGAGLAAAVLLKVDWGAKRSAAGVLKVSSSRLLRPPGALAEDEFVTACVRCGECMKVCPTNALQPAVGEGGLEALGTPVLVPRIGPCAQQCNACGQVCPTRAIEPFRPEEKAHLFMGTAAVNRSTCIAWSSDRTCLVCDEACSYNAISQVVENGRQAPVVHEDICVGCGICEWVCPVEPLGAIHVGSAGDRRHLSREEQRRLREMAAEPVDQTAGEAGRGGGRAEGAAGSPYPGL
jgi:ferredoxin-type protein NapF